MQTARITTARDLCCHWEGLHVGQGVSKTLLEGHVRNWGHSFSEEGNWKVKGWEKKERLHMSLYRDLFHICIVTYPNKCLHLVRCLSQRQKTHKMWEVNRVSCRTSLEWVLLWHLLCVYADLALSTTSVPRIEAGELRWEGGLAFYNTPLFFNKLLHGQPCIIARGF
jgi:hypothetical protein